MNTFQIMQNNLNTKRKNIEHNETLFSQANGLIGIRGTVNSTIDKSPGVFINGFYENTAIKYPEKAYGFPEIGETLVKLPNVFNYKIFVNDKIVDLNNKEKLKKFKRIFDLKKGIVKINFIYKINNKQKINVKIEKLVSFVNKNLMIKELSISLNKGSADLRIKDNLDFEIKNKLVKDDPRVGSHIQEQVLKIKRNYIEKNIDIYELKTKKSKNIVDIFFKYNINYEKNKNYTNQFNYKLETSKEFKLEKIVGIYPLRSLEKPNKSKDFHSIVKKDFKKLLFNSYSDFKSDNKEFLNDFWEKSKIEISGNEELSQGLHFNLYHLLQAAGSDGVSNICAKGLTGEGYEGHYFWDTEIYTLPFFLMTNPDIAKSLLMFRFNTLKEAKKRAKTLNFDKGAKFPWRTISGIELSSYFPAGTAQYHINADIAYAVNMYYRWTNDLDFMLNHGIDILVETSRFWLSVGHFNKRKQNQFTIEGVTGPDEYTALVNNNYYTNKMAKANLKYTIDFLQEIETNKKQEIFKRLSMSKNEISEFIKAYENMYLPFDNELKINPQDDSFLDKKKWPFDKVSKDKYPLLLNFHPMTIYNHQVLKQADVVLANVLVGDDISKNVKRNNFDYYEPITTHDSSLSTCVYSILACEIDELKKAYKLYKDNVRIDLDNSHNNSMHGVHTAAMGGAYLGIVYGFAGLRFKDNELHFNPKSIPNIEGYNFRMNFRGSIIKVKIKNDKVSYKLIKGKPVKFYHKEKCIFLKKVGEMIKI
ncbi:MAG: glycoside hydrolase family 65 protein [Bacillota bacterium]